MISPDLPGAWPEGREAISRWESEGGAISRPATGRSLRFLVVSADPQISLSLAAVLDGIGHQVCAIALTNDQAVRSASACHPDMVIADAYLDDDKRLMEIAPILRALFVPRVFSDAMPVPSSILRPGVLVLRRPFRANDLIRAICSPSDSGLDPGAAFGSAGGLGASLSDAVVTGAHG